MAEKNHAPHTAGDGAKKHTSMRVLFPGHYRPTEEELRALWSKAVFVLDANVLLNFYRYSQKTRESLTRVLHNLKERIWLPYQAAQEFHRNRATVIEQQVAAYETAKRETEQLLDKLKSEWKHPFVSEQTMEQSEKILKKLISELEERRTTSKNAARETHAYRS